MTRVHIALGANLGEPRAQIRAAFKMLQNLRESRLLRVSSLYRSRPWGHPSLGGYVNAACILETRLDPEELLEALLALEVMMGRVPPGEPGRNGLRPLDLDLLSFGDQILDRPGLKVPHPSLAFRTFVLVPLSEIDAFWNHPVLRKTAGELLTRVSPVSDVQWIEHPPWKPS